MGLTVVQWLAVALASALLATTVLYAATVSRQTVVSAALLLAVAAAPAVLIAAATGNLRRLLLAIALLEIPFQIDLNLGWSERAARFNAIGGFNVSLTTLILAVLYVWWTVEIFTGRDSPPSKRAWRYSLPSVAYLAAITFSLLVARDLTFGLYGLNLVVQALLLFFYILHHTRTRRDVQFIATVLLISLLIQSLILTALGAAGRTVDIGIVSSGHVDASGRPGGTLTSPNVAGAYLAMLLMVTFGLLATPSGWRLRTAATVGLGLGGLALLSTGSRGGWGGLLIAVVLFCFLAWRRRWLSLRVPLAYLCIALLIAAIFHEPILERLFGDQSVTTAESRGPLMVLALNMIGDHPLMGVGVNNFVFNLADYVTAEFSGYWITTVHNKYLLVWAESGIFGLVTFLWFLGVSLAQGWEVWKRQDRQLSPIALALTLAIVAWMIHMTVELFSSRIQLMMLWSASAVIGAMSRMTAEPD